MALHPKDVSPIPDQYGRHSDAPGKYRHILLVRGRHIDPGGNLDLDISITGYGLIGGSPKLYFTPEDGFLKGGEVTAGFVEGDNGKLVWGWPSPLGEITESITVHLSGGMVNESTEYIATMFGDFEETMARLQGKTEGWVDIPTPTIASEKMLGDRGPISFRLKIADKCAPGPYKIFTYLTYFNGREWDISEAEVQVKVRSHWERYSSWYTSLGALAALVSIAGAFKIL